MRIGFFPSDGAARAVAVKLYEAVKGLPIISPHGHTDPKWFAENKAFANPTALFLQPDHYVFRMLYSQGVSLESLGVPQQGVTGDAEAADRVDPREAWRVFAEHYYLFRGTPTRLWLDYSFSTLFGLTERLRPENADLYYETIDKALATPEFLPRSLYERFNMEVLATTDTATDSLEYHKAINASGWKGRVLPTFRPDAVVDGEYVGFKDNIEKLGEVSGEDVTHWKGYLNALRKRRAHFIEHGATATDHGHLTAMTADLSVNEASRLYQRIYSGRPEARDVELFQAQMLTEMAGMSVEDGLVMQLHPGSVRNHNLGVYDKFGRDKGADIPSPTEYVRSLRPLLSKYGNEANFTFILFTLDETTFSRELAPLRDIILVYGSGPPWWFHDSPEGMMRFRETATETAGFYNTVGFNDDTRALLSIPARHDVARRVDCAYLGRMVAEHRLDEDEAFEVAEAFDGGVGKEGLQVVGLERVEMTAETREENLPPDDLRRKLKLAQPGSDPSLPHIGIVGDTYTLLLTGEDTAGRFCLIDMHIPPGGGPPPHRHGFEETFTLLEGEMVATFRGMKSTVRAGETIHIPANAPHQFHNASNAAVRLLCICSPAGQENMFLELGVRVETRTTPPPPLNEAEQMAFRKKSLALAPKYRTEMLEHA